jgi:hypothetical protein
VISWVLMAAPNPRPRKRKGSRPLLAIALLGAVFASLYVGARAADAVTAFFGISSPTVALIIKVIAMAVALPAGFYIVERLFLKRTSR